MFKNELILEKGGKFITRFGSTMNMERPNVVYLRTKSKITPLTEKKEYDKEEIINFGKEFSEEISNNLKV